MHSAAPRYLTLERRTATLDRHIAALSLRCTLRLRSFAKLGDITVLAYLLSLSKEFLKEFVVVLPLVITVRETGVSKATRYLFLQPHAYETGRSARSERTTLLPR